MSVPEYGYIGLSITTKDGGCGEAGLMGIHLLRVTKAPPLSLDRLLSMMSRGSTLDRRRNDLNLFLSHLLQGMPVSR